MGQPGGREGVSFILLVGDRTQRPDPPSPLTAQTSEVLADSRFRVDRTRGVWTLEMCVYSYIYICNSAYRVWTRVWWPKVSDPVFIRLYIDVVYGLILSLQIYNVSFTVSSMQTALSAETAAGQF